MGSSLTCCACEKFMSQIQECAKIKKEGKISILA
jgi:hypothetical protein